MHVENAIESGLWKDSFDDGVDGTLMKKRRLKASEGLVNEGRRMKRKGWKLTRAMII